MKLEELQQEYLKKYSYSKLYKKYFEIGTNTRYFPIKRIGITLCIFIFFFLISYLFTLPKLENESLYIFAAQVTIIALIFPIILTLIGILYSKKNDFNSIFKIYIANTNAKVLYRGSFITLIFYVISFFYLYDSSVSEQIRRALNVTLAITFIDGLIVMLFFLEKTLAFTTTKGTNDIFLRHYINSDKNDESINILSIISNRINDDIQNNDLNTYEKNLDFFMEFLDIVIIQSTKNENKEISSNLHQSINNDLFSTKFSKIISLIEININNAIQHSDRQYYQNIKSIYFYIFSKNHNFLENKTTGLLLASHHRHCYYLSTHKTDKIPQIINDFVSSWYKWLKPYQKINLNTHFLIYKNHLELTINIIDHFAKEKNFRGLDYFCDCLSRWESETKCMPNYIEPESHLKTISEIIRQETLANLATESKLIAFYLIQKQDFNISNLTKYYKLLIKGNILFKTTDLCDKSYSFSSLDDIIFSYFRLLINYQYKNYFNNILETSDRIIEITGLMYGGWIPSLTNRITKLVIQLLILDSSKNTPNTYRWQQALDHISLAKVDKIMDIVTDLTKQIVLFDDYSSLNWDEKKLNISKIKLLTYLEKIKKLVKQFDQNKYLSIQLNQDKVNTQVTNNTFYFKDLEECLTKSTFNLLQSQKIIKYRKNIKKIKRHEALPSKYLTFDYDIHLDNIFKLDYYILLIDNEIFNIINKKKSTEHYLKEDNKQLLLKILLRSYIFASPIVIFGSSELLRFIKDSYRTSNFPYKIESYENHKYYKIGKTIFKYAYDFPENTVYIMTSHILENITLEKLTPETLSEVSVTLVPEDPTRVSIEVSFPIEVTLTKNSQVIKIIIS